MRKVARAAPLTWPLLAVLVTGLPPTVADEIDDAAVRAEFGFYAGEVSTIDAAIAAFERAQVPERDGLRLAQLGYAYWKLAQLEARADQAAATTAAQDCVTALEEAIVLESRLPEAHAVQSACHGLLAQLGSLLKAPISARRRDKRLATALSQAADNPRVRLIEGLSDYDRAAAAGGDTASAHRNFRDAVAAFEAEDVAGGNGPRWGHAEALAWLGKTSMEQGDLAMARESLERALIIAPQYAWAKDLLAEVTRARSTRD